jgi:hypothetical protein
MNQQQHDKVPLFKTWTQWYVLVVAVLFVLIILFKLFTNYFA